jgi:hypothetical protein
LPRYLFSARYLSIQFQTHFCPLSGKKVRKTKTNKIEDWLGFPSKLGIQWSICKKVTLFLYFLPTQVGAILPTLVSSGKNIPANENEQNRKNGLRPGLIS